MEKITHNQALYIEAVKAYHIRGRKAWEEKITDLLWDVGEDEMENLSNWYDNRWDGQAEQAYFQDNRWQYE